MKIKSSDTARAVQFKDLSPGDVFRYADPDAEDDALYLRTDDEDADCEPTTTNAVDMAGGIQVRFAPNDAVVRIQGVFVVEGGAK